MGINQLRLQLITSRSAHVPEVGAPGAHRGDIINDLVWPLPASEAVSTASADTEPARLAAGGPDGGVAPVAARSLSPGPPDSESQ